VIQQWNDQHESAAAYMALYEELGSCVSVGMQTYGPEPKTYKEAMASPDKKLWWESMCKKFGNVEQKKVWLLKKMTEVPKHKKITGNK